MSGLYRTLIRPQLLISMIIGTALAAAGLAADLISSRMESQAHSRRANFVLLLPDHFASWKLVAMPAMMPKSQSGEMVGPYEHVIETRFSHPDGSSVMLSIAYGANQLNDRFHAHRPEYCYKAQGFDIIEINDGHLQVQGRVFPVRHMVAVNKNRIEHVTYWMTVADRVTLPGWQRKFAQIDSGLHGVVPDGYLVRVSTLGGDRALADAVQKRFLVEWLEALPEFSRRHLIGRNT